MQITNALGQILNLNPNTALNVERYNPLFNDADKFFADIVYPFKAPPTPSNKLFFKGGHRVEAQNDVYEFAVQVHTYGTHFFTGQLVYKITGEDFDCNLKVNFGAIADKVKNTRLPEIRSDDADYTYQSANKPTFEAYMKSICITPANHNLIFLPVINKGFDSHSGWYNPGGVEFTDFIINNYNYEQEKFRTIAQLNTEDIFQTILCPFFKLNYITSLVIKYLGYNPQGAFFTDPEINKLYIYTRKGAGDFNYAGLWYSSFNESLLINYSILESMVYMPNMSISDFLKQIKERFHLAIDFDAISGVCTVVSYATVINGPTQDLSPYLTNIEEISTPESGGFKVTLKPDEQDEFMGKLVDGQTVYSSEYSMQVGKALKEVELECSTLKAIGSTKSFTKTKQPVIQSRYVSAEQFPLTDEQNPNTRNNWPLRLLRYKGWISYNLGTGIKYGPFSTSVELDDTDAAYYQFLTSAKNVIITINIPQSKLAQLKATDLISFTTSQGAYIKALIKKISFQLIDGNSRVTAKIEALTLVVSPDVQIKFTDNSPIVPQQGFLFSSYFSKEIHNITTLKIEVTLLGAETITANIINPTDSGGAGGTPAGITFTSPTVPDQTITLKITQGKPKYVMHLGKKYDFIIIDNAYHAVLYINNPLGIDTYWIVF